MEKIWKKAKRSCTSYLHVHFVVLSCCYYITLNKAFLPARYLFVCHLDKLKYWLSENLFASKMESRDGFNIDFFFFKWHREMYILSLCRCKSNPFILQSRKLNSRCQHCKLNVELWKWSFAVSDSSYATRNKVLSAVLLTLRLKESPHLWLMAQVGIAAFSSYSASF